MGASLKRAIVVSIAVASATDDCDAGGKGVKGHSQLHQDQVQSLTCTCPDNGFKPQEGNCGQADFSKSGWCCVQGTGDSGSVKECTMVEEASSHLQKDEVQTPCTCADDDFEPTKGGCGEQRYGSAGWCCLKGKAPSGSVKDCNEGLVG